MPIKLSDLKPHPDNPRIIKDVKFKKLVESITKFPKMMTLRPLIVDEKNIIFGGNQRYQALVDIGHESIPDEWVRKMVKFTPAEKREFMIKDNISSGDWEWEELQMDFKVDELVDWGMDPWNFGQIDYATEPETVEKNIEEMEKIKAARKKGAEGIQSKTDTEKYLVIVFNSREEKQALLKELNLPEDERYIPAGGVQIIPSGAWISKFKSSARNKSGAQG